MKIIYKDGTVAECPEELELEVIRHTAAHVLAQAVKRLYPEADFGYGPATEKGFYYDVDLGDIKLTDEDLNKIEAEMRKIVKENLPIKPFILPRAEAIKLMQDRKEKYKVEHIGDLPDDAVISFYQQGEYIDMCVGPHLCYTKALKAFKITQQSGAYWKNDKNNKMLTRIGGIAFRTQEELDAELDNLAADETVNGILLQLPLPAHLNERAALKKIPVEKDVDGFSEENVGLLAANRGGIAACTPLGVMKMLEYAGVSPCGKHAVVIGRSNTVGRPMALLLLNADATVTICHSKTRNLKEICRDADILIAAIGRKKFVTADMVKEGATVIDVGINRDENGKLCGDVDFENVSKKAYAISPVPGGVGPMTITMLMYNTFLAAENQKARREERKAKK